MGRRTKTIVVLVLRLAGLEFEQYGEGNGEGWQTGRAERSYKGNQSARACASDNKMIIYCGALQRC